MHTSIYPYYDIRKLFNTFNKNIKIVKKHYWTQKDLKVFTDY